MHVVFENRVRFEETDAQGIVFYGNYLTYQDETMMAYLEAVGYSYETIHAADWETHVVHAALDYRQPATFGDELENAARIRAINESSIEFEYECRREGEVLVEGSVVHVAVDADGQPTRVPQGFRDAVVGFQDEPPEPV